jgi:hypothetical protein
MWILLGVTVLLLVAMVLTVLRLIDQSDSHVESVSKVKFKLSNMQLRMKKSEADEMIESDIKKDQYRTEAAYPHWEMSKRSMKMIGSMENLNSLDLSDATFKDSWLRYLEKLPLQKLKMPGTTVSDEGSKHIAKIATLQQLSVFDTNVSGKTIGIIAPLKDLTLLHINGTKTDDEDIKGLTAFPKLNSLNLAGTFITEAGCVTLAKLDQLRMLEVSHVTLTKLALERLKPMQSLVSFRVRGCGINDEMAVILSQYPHLAELDLNENPDLTDKGLEAISKLPNLQSLTVVDCPKITKAGIEKFRKTKPTCRVSVDKRVVAI